MTMIYLWVFLLWWKSSESGVWGGVVGGKAQTRKKEKKILKNRDIEKKCKKRDICIPINPY